MMPYARGLTKILFLLQAAGGLWCNSITRIMVRQPQFLDHSRPTPVGEFRLVRRASPAGTARPTRSAPRHLYRRFPPGLMSRSLQAGQDGIDRRDRRDHPRTRG